MIDMIALDLNSDVTKATIDPINSPNESGIQFNLSIVDGSCPLSIGIVLARSGRSMNDDARTRVSRAR